MMLTDLDAVNAMHQTIRLAQSLSAAIEAEALTLKVGTTTVTIPASDEMRPALNAAIQEFAAGAAARAARQMARLTSEPPANEPSGDVRGFPEDGEIIPVEPV